MDDDPMPQAYTNLISMKVLSQPRENFTNNGSAETVLDLSLVIDDSA